MFKLSKHGFKGSAYDSIKNFLVYRKQFVKLGVEVSDETIMLSGVPQGTALGPLLFLCSSADINDSINDSVLSTCMYADNTKLFKGIQNRGDCMLMKHDLNAISIWADSWQLTLNPAKTKHLTIDR